jgi:hypothetical protein
MTIARMRLGDSIGGAIEGLVESAATTHGEAQLEGDQEVAEIAKEVWEFARAMLGRIEALPEQP